MPNNDELGFFDKHVEAYSKDAGRAKEAMEKGKEWVNHIPKTDQSPMTHRLSLPSQLGTKNKK